MKQVLAAVLLALSFHGLPESCARPQISLADLMTTPNYQLAPPFIPIRIAACPTCQLLGYRPMQYLQGTVPFMPLPPNNINENILTDRVPGAWSSIPALNKPPQPVQLPTSTLISALISYINYLRQNLDGMANQSNNNCNNSLPPAPSNVSSAQPPAPQPGGEANDIVTSAPMWPRTSIQSKPVPNNTVSTQP